MRKVVDRESNVFFISEWQDTEGDRKKSSGMNLYCESFIKWQLLFLFEMMESRAMLRVLELTKSFWLTNLIVSLPKELMSFQTLKSNSLCRSKELRYVKILDTFAPKTFLMKSSKLNIWTLLSLSKATFL